MNLLSLQRYLYNFECLYSQDFSVIDHWLLIMSCQEINDNDHYYMTYKEICHLHKNLTNILKKLDQSILLYSQKILLDEKIKDKKND